MTSVVQMRSSYLEQSSLIKTSIGSPGGHQMDHVLVNGTMRTSILDTRVMRGADVYSDHYLVKTRIRLKLARAEGRKNVRERFDVSKLQSETIRRKHNNEVRNRFETLGDIDDPEEEHDMIFATYRDGAKKVWGGKTHLVGHG